MTKQILLTVFLFVVALTSGVFIGMNVARHGERPPEGRSRLTEELKLTPDQQIQMRAIWQELAPGPGRQHNDKRRQLSKERDDAVAALFTPDQKTAYDKVLEHYNQQMAEMNHERDLAFQKAVERTKAILTPEQRTKYEEILAKEPFGRGRGGATTGPTTRRAEQ